MTLSITAFRSLLSHALRVVLAGALFALAGGAHAGGKEERASLLALGDSVVFGYITADGFAYTNPDNFLAYPELVGRSLGLEVANPSCPGETSAGFLSVVAPDNGCRPFRSRFPLHESYGGTQMEFATEYLLTHPKTKLVTLSIGANDGFLLLAECRNDGACIQARLPGALATVFGNVSTILGNIRATGYKGLIVVVNYYSTNYADAAATALSVALNQTLAGAAATYGAVVADAFTAFRDTPRTVAAGGQTCRAGLLNGDPTNPAECDVHPSLSGQRLLAATVRATYRVFRRHDD